MTKSLKPGGSRQDPERRPLLSQRTLLIVIAAIGAGMVAAASPTTAVALTVGAAVLALLHNVTGE